MSKVVNGVFAAVSTPRKQDGSVDKRSLQISLAFLLDHHIRGFAINGATGEYCVTTTAELKQILTVANRVLSGSARFVVGIGSAGIHGCVENGKVAIDGGAAGVLLPMPHFFPYAQGDLVAFCSEVAKRLPIPILLYNLPQFTSGLDSSTVQQLITNCPNIVGIKDSSGSLATLRDLTTNVIDSCRVVGNDAAFVDSLREDVADGVISGVAGVLPELILSIYALKLQTDQAEFSEKDRLLTEFLTQINTLPIPWGLKMIGESRGIIPASFSQPLSARRLEQKQALQNWFQEWIASGWL